MGEIIVEIKYLKNNNLAIGEEQTQPPKRYRSTA